MYIYIVTLLVKNTENISEFLLYYLVKVVLIQIAHNISALEKNVDKGYYNEKFLSASFEIACQSIFAKWIEHAFTVMKKKMCWHLLCCLRGELTIEVYQTI